MSDLRDVFEQELTNRQDITVERWKDSDLICVNYKGKEIAHFQARTVLDIRLSPKIIKAEQLSRAPCAKYHPQRSQNSRWICVPFKTKSEVENLMRLVDIACQERAT